MLLPVGLVLRTDPKPPLERLRSVMWPASTAGFAALVGPGFWDVGPPARALVVEAAGRGLGVWGLSLLSAGVVHRGHLPPPTAGHGAAGIGFLAGATDAGTGCRAGASRRRLSTTCGSMAGWVPMAGTRAWILIDMDRDDMLVSVRDDGPGIAPGRLEEARLAGRRGVVHSIQGRIRDVGGRAEVLSVAGQGTEVEMRVPRTAGGLTQACR